MAVTKRSPDPSTAEPVSSAADRPRPGPSAPVFFLGLLGYAAVGLGFMAIGGWLGLGLILALAAAVIAGLIAIS